MLVELENKPIAMAHLEKHSDVHYFAITHYHEDIAYVAIIVDGKVAQIHAEVEVPWSRTVGAVMLNAWTLLKCKLQEYGCEYLITANSDLEDEKRWTKFITLFGFPPPEHILYAERRL